MSPTFRRLLALPWFLAVSLVPVAAAAEMPAQPPRQIERPRVAWPEADLGLAVVGVAYEHVVVPALSLRAAAGYTRAWYTKGDPSGFYAEARPFVFVTGTAPAGFYVSPFARVGKIRAQKGDYEGTGTGWTAGATAGYGWVIGRVLVRAGVGAQVWRFEVDTAAGRAGLRGLQPDIDAIVGYGF